MNFIINDKNEIKDVTPYHTLVGYPKSHEEQYSLVNVDEFLSSCITDNEKIEKMLNAANIHPQINPCDNGYTMTISHGHYKHDHTLCDKLMAVIGYQNNEHIIEQDGSGYYSSIHTYTDLSTITYKLPTEKKSTLGIGSTVFFYYTNNDNIYEGIIEKPDSPDDLYKQACYHNDKIFVRVNYKIKDNGDKEPPTREAAKNKENPVWHLKLDQLYTSPETARKNMNKYHKDWVKKYTLEIQTIDDLLIFPLKHDLPANKDAFLAYKQQSEKLLKIDIDKVLASKKQKTKKKQN